jgi:hypothetical protein
MTRSTVWAMALVFGLTVSLPVLAMEKKFSDGKVPTISKDTPKDGIGGDLLSKKSKKKKKKKA